jgi:hypothetical protein
LNVGSCAFSLSAAVRLKRRAASGVRSSRARFGGTRKYGKHHASLRARVWTSEGQLKICDLKACEARACGDLFQNVRALPHIVCATAHTFKQDEKF